MKYRAWAQGLKRSMRQTHIAGEKLFVDYAGQTVPIVDAATGEITAAQIFVATLGASNYTYACATRRQTTADWIGAQIQALEFFGGVPRLIVPDQARALIKRPDRYDPEPNAPVRRVRRPLRLRAAGGPPGAPARQAQGGERRAGRRALDPGAAAQPALLQPGRAQRGDCRVAGGPEPAPLQEAARLPAQRLRGLGRTRRCGRCLPKRFELFSWKTAKVNIDYHVEFEGHYYSVPHRLVGQAVELRVTAKLVEAFLANQRVASHARSALIGRHTTAAEHMPASHRAHLQWTPAKLIDWGQRIGVSAAAVVTWQLEHRPHPEQGYRACLGLQRLAREYTPARLEAACTRALAIRSPTYRSVASILKTGLDRQTSLLPNTTPALPAHENVRGPDYYH